MLLLLLSLLLLLLLLLLDLRGEGHAPKILRGEMT